MLLVAVTLPVTSASYRRSFSKMKLVKTFTTNSMTSSGVTEGGQGCAPPPPRQAKYKKWASLLACISVFSNLWNLVGFCV